MEPFRRTRGGGARAWIAASEASLLRSLVEQVMTLIAPDGPEPPTGAPGEPGWEDVTALEALLHEPTAPAGESPQAPEDPVLARLLPDGYRDDPEAAGEFRRYTEPELRSGKQQAAQEMLDTLPDAGGRIQLTRDQAVAWLKALNDVRLAIGTVLGITEDYEAEMEAASWADPRSAYLEVYHWLGYVQDSLVRALW